MGALDLALTRCASATNGQLDVTTQMLVLQACMSAYLATFVLLAVGSRDNHMCLDAGDSRTGYTVPHKAHL